MDTSKDISNLKNVILRSIEQVNEEFSIYNDNQNRIKKFEEVIVYGMGGSALPIEVLLSGFFQLSENKKLAPIFIHRSYGLARRSGENTLAICISYSGNTEETISSYEANIQAGIETVAVASGGALIDLAKQYSKPYVIIPNPFPQFQPRYATLYLLKAVITILSNYRILDLNVGDRLIQTFINVNPAEFEQQGMAIAERIKGKTPVIYASNEFKTASLIWKIKINENAKTPAFHNFFPELNHNEMVGFTNPQANFIFLFLQNSSEQPRIVKRMEIMKDLFQKRGMEIIDVQVPDSGNYLANLMSMILIGDWTAYYLALQYGIDPTPVDMVEEFKVLLK